jgi:fibronectin-binding autotransporter adhesin
LSGPSTGVTNLNGNNLTLTNGGVYAGSIANGTATGGRLNVSGGTFVLTGTAGVAGGVISSSNLSLQDGAVNTASIGGTLVLNASALSFDLGTGTADKLTVGGAASFNGTDAINLDLIAGQTITSGNYTLMTTGGGLTPGGSNFTLGTKPAGFNTYNFSNSTSTSLVLSITANAAVVGADYWTGLASSTGSPTDANNYWGYGASLGTPMSNWSTTSNGLTDPLQVPGSQSDVIFTASNATPTAGSILVTTLDGSYAIDSLTFAGSGSNNITAIGINASGNTLTISGANNGGNGIVLTAASLASGSIGGTTGSLVVVNGSQNWANNNATLPLNVSTGITAFSGATTLTLNGTGAGGVVLGGVIGNGGGTLGLVLNQAGLTQITGSNTFTGGVTINSGTVQLGNASAFNSTTPNTLTFGSASTGDLQLNGNSIAVASLNTNATTPGTTIVENASATAATLTVKATGQNTFAGTVQDGTGGGALSLALSGTGSLNLSGTISTSGSVTVGSGTTLTESGTDTSTGATSVSGGGTIVLAANSSATGGLVIHDGGTLQLVATTANTTAGVSNAAGNRAVNSIQLSDGINTATSNALIQLRSDSTVTFANTATGTATGNTTLTFDVNNITSGVTGNTLSFGALGTFQTVINVTGGNGYIFSLAGVSNGNGSFVTFKPTTANAVVGPISNTSVVTMAGTGTLFLVNDGSGNGSSTTGVYDFASGITNVAGLTDYGTAGPLGARAASQEVPAGNGIGLLFEGGTLQYTGSTPQETNRQIRMSNNATNTIDASGSVPSATVDFSYSGTNTNLFETAGTRTLNLTGTNTGQNIFAISLTDQGTNPTSLTKSGAGTWVLTGSSTYSGATSIKAGTLALNSSGAVLTNSSLINVSSGAIFDISANPTFVLAPTATLAGNGTVNGFYNHSAGTLSPGGTGTIGTLTFNNDLTFSGGILRLDLNGSSTTVGSGVNDLVAVNGNLNLSAGTTTTLTVVATPTPAINSIYKVITYTGALNTDGLPHLVAPNRAYSVITSVPGAIELEYTGGAAGNLVWNSASNQNWDTTTANWYNTGTLAIDRYFSGDNVAFNDSTGSPVTAPQTTINLTSTMLPSSVTVNTNIVNYTFAGNGSIGGTATLTMNGSSLLTISTANPYSGDTSVNAGTVLVTGTTGAGLGTGNLNISSGATVQVGNGTATPVPTNISINDNGALTFNSSTGMTLAMIISGSGTLNQLGTNQLFINVANSYGGGTNIVSGSIQTQNNLALGTGLVTINGGQLYATQSGGTNFTNAFNLSSPTPTAALQAGGGGVTTISGPVTLIGNTVLQIDGGSTIGFLDTPTAVSGANFNLVVNGDGGSSFALGGSTNLGTGTISVGANTVLKFEPPTATTITIPNSIIAAGGVQQTGLGTTILSVSNSYTGGTQVVSGVLEVTNSNALGNSSGVSINGGNPLPVTTANLSLSSGITLSQNFTLGGRAGASATTPEIVNLDSANTLTGTIATATGGNNYIVESDGGTLTLTGSFAPNGPTGVRFLDLQGTASGVWSGAITDGTAVVTVTKSGTGTWNLSSGNSYSGGTVINAGLLVAASGVSSLGSGLTTVNGGGVIFTDTPANAIFPMLQSGFNGGAWNGTTGITSTAAAGDTTHLHAVGFLQPTSATTFEGQSLATSDVAVKYTYYGDANLDGKVDGSDYSLIDNGYLQGLTGWQNGDFNYDGVVDGSDYTLIDNAFNSQGVQISAEVASATAQIAGAGASSAVPEPASLGFLGIAAVGLLGRKGRRHSDW